MKAISLFAGAGGIDISFKNAGIDVIWANEIEPKAVETLKLNFPNTEIINDDIKKVKMSKIPKHDVLLAGFPCQAFSIAGYRKGFDDERGELFFDVLKIIKNKKPRVVFLENVKNLVSHDGGNTFRVIYSALEENGYKVDYRVMNATEYGNLPQNRERIYIVAFKNKTDKNKFEFPLPIERKKEIKDVINFNEKIEDKYYYTAENFKHFEVLNETVKTEKTIYQWRRQYVRENKSNVSPTLTANMGTGGHNVPIIYTRHGIRKLTPRECFNLQGYPEDYILPDDMAISHLYKQAGNSVAVPVIYRIAEKIKNAIIK